MMDDSRSHVALGFDVPSGVDVDSADFLTRLAWLRENLSMIRKRFTFGGIFKDMQIDFSLEDWGPALSVRIMDFPDRDSGTPTGIDQYRSDPCDRQVLRRHRSSSVTHHLATRGGREPSSRRCPGV